MTPKIVQGKNPYRWITFFWENVLLYTDPENKVEVKEYFLKLMEYNFKEQPKVVSHVIMWGFTY